MTITRTATKLCPVSWPARPGRWTEGPQRCELAAGHEGPHQGRPVGGYGRWTR